MKTGSDLNNNARGGNHGIDGINIALRLLLLYLLSCALGFVYYWICEIPIIFVVVPLGYGMVAGYLAWAVLVKPLKVTKRALIILLSCVVGVMALLMSWTWSVFYISESGDFVLNPLKLFGWTTVFVEQREIIVSNGSPAKIPIKGLWLGLAYLAEAAMIIGSAGYIGWSSSKKYFFCKECDQWADETFESKPLVPENLESFREEIEKKNFAALQGLAAGDKKKEHVKVEFVFCDKCERSFVSVVLCKVETAKAFRLSEDKIKETKIIDKEEIPPEMRKELVERYKQIATR